MSWSLRTGLLSEAQRFNWLRLIRSDGVGPASFRALMSRYGTAARALETLPELARRGGARRPVRIAPRREIDEEIALADRLGVRYVALGECDYPERLRHIDSAPPLLGVRGSVDLLGRDFAAIVGARNSSIAGSKMAAALARDLGGRGFGIVSGLARGIDAAAHTAALETGTLAVFAGGLDLVYPSENERLFSDILANNGAAISEMPLGWQIRGRDFPRRNRLVSGVAAGVVVIEAAKRSGSLITARLAVEQGREVFAVPGSPLDPRSVGVNALIRDGATLVTKGADVEEALRSQLELPPERTKETVSVFEDTSAARVDALVEVPVESEREKIATALGPTPVSIDDIIRVTGISPGAVQVVLLELDIAGRLQRHGAQQISLI